MVAYLSIELNQIDELLGLCIAIEQMFDKCLFFAKSTLSHIFCFPEKRKM